MREATPSDDAGAGAPDPDEAPAGPPDAGAAPGAISTRPIFEGRIVHLSVDTVRFPDGSVGELEMIRHSGAAAVLPVLDDPGEEDPRIVLVRQYRYATGGYLLEVPAGRPDRPGEDWEVCARRELEEETGLTAERLVPLGTIFTTPGFTDERIHLFLALGIREDGVPAPDADEFVEPVTLTLSDALARVRAGSIVDAKTICTLHHAAAHLRNGLR